jgi:alpha-glucosidase (family GH31 glycosyl hydrolase)
MVDKNTPEFQTWLKGRLHESTEDVLVTFTKKDGTERKMRCTLAESRIPTDKQPKSAKEKTDSDVIPASQPVFDLDINEWRAFRWDSLTEVDVREAV